jgi:hypothetical protein
MKTSGRKTVKGAAVGTAGKVSKAGKAASETAVHMPPTHEEIAVRSYEIYLSRGAIDGHDVEDWLQAEAELGV